MKSPNQKSQSALKATIALVLLSPTLLIAGTAQAVPVEISSFSFEDLSESLVATDSISANTGLATGESAPVASSDVPFSDPSNKSSAEFNGSNSFEINNNIGTDFTICAWIKTSSRGGGQHWTSAPIFDSESGGPALDFGFGINQDGKLVFGNGGYDSGANLGDSQVDGNTVVADSAWHHVCVTRNNTQGEINFFVDGVLDMTGITGTGVLTNNSKAKIGNGYDGNQPYVGWIDELRVFTSVLSAEEVKVVSTPPGDDGNNTDAETENPDETVIEDKVSLADTGDSESGSGLLHFAALLIATGLATLFVSKRRKLRN